MGIRVAASLRRAALSAMLKLKATVAGLNYADGVVFRCHQLLTNWFVRKNRQHDNIYVTDKSQRVLDFVEDIS